MAESLSRRAPLACGTCWRALLLASLVVIGGLVVFIVLTNALYLGWHDFAWYITRARTWRNFGLSVSTASAATIVAMLLAVPVGYALSRGRVPLGRLVDAIIDLPIMVPPAAVGMFLLGFFGVPPAQWVETILGLKVAHALPGVVVAQVAVTVSFGVRVAKSAFDQTSRRLDDVSRTLGAPPSYTFRRVTLPIAKSGLLAGLIIVWARAIAEYESLMLFVGAIQGRTDVMPLAVYLDVTVGKLEWAITQSLLCMAVGLLSVLAFRRLGGRGYFW